MSLTPSGCPKSMVYGPCGGVGHDGSCEVDDRRCPFVDKVTVSWTNCLHEPRDVVIPKVIVDHRPTGDSELDSDILTGYRALGVAVLLGDHLDDPTSLDRLAAARRTTAMGVQTIATITGRDRSAEERSRLIERFVEAGVAAVLCVTGDHPAARFRQHGFSQHGGVDFVSEGTLLAHDARNSGAVVAVAESPSAPPRTLRSHRLRAKQAAGADFVILNHGGSVADTLAFAEAVRDDGVDLPLIAAVPVMTDRRSVDALDQFPGVDLVDSDVRKIVEATDPVEAGVDAAVRVAHDLVASGLVAGVNLSGIATGSGPEERSRIMRRIASRLA